MKTISIAVLLGLFVTLNAFALPPHVEADRQLLSAKEAIERNDFATAQKSFEKILSLNVPVPKEFNYHYAKVLFRNKNYQGALESLTKYLNDEGAQGRYYTESLELYNRVEKAQREEAEQIKRLPEKLLSELVKLLNQQKIYVSHRVKGSRQSVEIRQKVQRVSGNRCVLDVERETSYNRGSFRVNANGPRFLWQRSEKVSLKPLMGLTLLRGGVTLGVNHYKSMWDWSDDKTFYHIAEKLFFHSKSNADEARTIMAELGKLGYCD